MTLFALTILSFNNSNARALTRRQRGAKVPGGAGPTATIGSPLSLSQADLARSRGSVGPQATDGSKIIIMTAQIENFAVQL